VLLEKNEKGFTFLSISSDLG